MMSGLLASHNCQYSRRSAAPRLRPVSAVVSVAGAAVTWLALLGPVIALLTHLSGSAVVSFLGQPINHDDPECVMDLMDLPATSQRCRRSLLA